MFHQESELPLATEPDFFGSLHSVNDVIFLAWLYFRRDGLLDRKLIKLTANNRDRMCEEYEYGGLHDEPPHYPFFYEEKGRYHKAALQLQIKKSEAKYGNN